MDVSSLETTLNLQQKAFVKNRYPSYQERIQALQQLKQLLLTNQQEIIAAISEDFGHRSADDTKIGDILTTVSAINYTISHLKKWMKPEKRHIGILFQPAQGEVQFQPLGVVGIMVPWNYPLFLSLGPLATAIAAGNNVMIKMSEATPKTNHLLAQLFATKFDQSRVVFVGGEVNMASQFSSLNFDHLLFTGSTRVGKAVMKAAAENLVPVTLELGGKSPAIIAPDINVKTAVERFVLGKTLNSGQTCVAPDYILCPKGKVEELVSELTSTYNAMYPNIKDNKDCTSVVNDNQYHRLQTLLTDAEEKGAKIMLLSGDDGCSKLRQMPLTLLENVNDDMQVMQQEIFGPLLPIVEYDSLEHAIDYVNSREKPLALYIFSFDKNHQQQLLKSTHSGGVCINDAAFHVANDDLPFGGVGSSGMGQYHGKEGFRTFSHCKPVLSRGRISFAKLLFPPFGTWVHKLVYRVFIR